MVPAVSRRIPRVPRYSGSRWGSRRFRLRGSHLLCPTFPRRSATVPSSRVAVLQPRDGLDRPGLGSSAFARHYSRNHFCSLLLGVLRCFSSPRSPRPWGAVPPLLAAGFPIRTSPDRIAFADPRGFSQLIASFIASMSQGIHPSPFSRFLLPGSFRNRGSFLVFFVFQTCQRSSAVSGLWRIRDSNP